MVEYSRNKRELKKISFNEFVQNEFLLCIIREIKCSLLSSIDGLKEIQRSIIRLCLEKKIYNYKKVSDMASRIECSDVYESMKIVQAIIRLAQNFVGTNNLNLLVPRGQFGSRLFTGEDAASPYDISTSLNPLCQLLFKCHYDDHSRENFLCPVLPLILVNGAEGSCSTWMSKIPSHNPKDIIENIESMINGQEPIEMKPYYKNFRGTIYSVDGVLYP
jgi:DNA topoisomerase-2